MDGGLFLDYIILHFWAEIIKYQRPIINIRCMIFRISILAMAVKTNRFGKKEI
jgi:hypothetical protein